MKFLDLFYRSLFILLILLRNNYYKLKQVDEESYGKYSTVKNSLYFTSKEPNTVVFLKEALQNISSWLLQGLSKRFLAVAVKPLNTDLWILQA